MLPIGAAVAIEPMLEDEAYRRIATRRFTSITPEACVGSEGPGRLAAPNVPEYRPQHSVRDVHCAHICAEACRPRGPSLPAD